MHRTRWLWWLAALAVLAALQGTAAAQQDEESWKSDRFFIAAGAFWPNFRTTLQVDSPSTGVEGTLLDLEDDLGLTDREALGIAAFRWRIARRHTLDVAYYDLVRSGSTVLEGDITWGDIEIIEGAQVESYFDTRVFRVAYYYAPVQKEKVSFFFGGGLYVMKIDTGITEVGGSDLSAAEGLTAPLPMIGIGFNYHFLPKWSLGLLGEFLDVRIQGISGRLLHGAGEVRWRTWEHVGFVFGYIFFDIQVEAGNDDLEGIVEYRYWGPLFQFAFRWGGG